jgi:hypothetical protein
MDPYSAIGGTLLSGISGALSAWGTPKLDVDKAASGAFSNAFGETGQVAGNRARNAFSNLGNTAGARMASNNLNNLSAASLGGMQSTSDAASQAALANYGNTRRSLINSNMAAGGSPSSLAGLMDRLNDSNSQTASTLAQQNSDSLARAISQASSNYSASQNVLQSDLNNQTNIMKTQLADFNPTLFGASMDAQSQLSPWQGFLQGSSTAIGSLGSRMTGNAMNDSSSKGASDSAKQNSLSSPDGSPDFMSMAKMFMMGGG